MASTDYVTIRDDDGLKSLSINEATFLKDNSAKKLRADGRSSKDVRNIKLQLSRWDNGSETTVQWGKTRVTAVCTAELTPPSPDRPNEGAITFAVDLSPMASSNFRLAPAVSTGQQSIRSSNFADPTQKLLSNRILRCVERILIMGGALDTEALVLEAGQWVWKLQVNISVLDHSGNLLDACVLATVAALRHYRKPQVELSGGGEGDNTPSLPTMIPSTVKEATPLPLHHSPLSISFGLIDIGGESNNKIAALLDPTNREELVQAGSLTIAMNIHAEICLLDYGGGCELTREQLKDCCGRAGVAVKELCQLLEDNLQQADEQAQAERLRLLQLQTHSSLPPLPQSVTPNVPFLQQLDAIDMDTTVDDTQVQQVQTAAEEAYRKQALDYASGHFATAVREDNEKDHKSKQNASSLLAAMLKSVGEKEGTGGDNVGTASKPEDKVKDTPTETTEQDVPAKKGAMKKPQAATKPAPMDLDDDEDEEEAPMVLQSEFDSVKKESVKEEEQVDPDIEDLSMAIKSRKSKKKKSKKKKTMGMIRLLPIVLFAWRGRNNLFQPLKNQIPCHNRHFGLHALLDTGFCDTTGTTKTRLYNVAMYFVLCY